MVEGLTPPASGLDEERELASDLLLIDEIFEGRGPERPIELTIRQIGSGVVNPRFGALGEVGLDTEVDSATVDLG